MCIISFPQTRKQTPWLQAAASSGSWKEKKEKKKLRKQQKTPHMDLDLVESKP